MIALIVLLLLAWFLTSIYSFFNALRHNEKISRLEESIKNLREEIRRGKDGSGEKEKEAPAGFAKPEVVIVPQTPPQSPLPSVAPPVFETEIESKSAPEIILHQTILEPETKTHYQAPAPRKPSRTQAEWEALIGGKILNRIGALALIIGVGFFLKYAFDNNWITETMRVVIGIVTGFLLLFGGHHFQKKDYKIFSQGLSGAGIAILYLAVYSAFNFYHLVPQITAMLMMSAVTAITFWQAFKYDSQIIALFGWLGGFLTPFLLSTGQANEIGLFSYIAILDFGLLLVAMKKSKWFLLEPLSLLATILVYSLWFGEFYTQEAEWITIGFSLIFWILFLLVELKRITTATTEIKFHHQIISIANGSFFYLSMFAIINPHHHKWMGLTTVIFAISYLILFLWIRKKRPADQVLQIRYLLSIVLLCVIAAGIQFDQLEITIAWAIESIVLIFLAVRYRHLPALLSGLGILLFAIFSFLTSRDGFEIPFRRYHFIFNIRALALFVLFLSALGSRKIAENFNNNFSKYIREGLCYAWMLFLFGLISIETQNYAAQLSYISREPWDLWYLKNVPFLLSIEWTFLSVPFWYFGRKKINKALFNGAAILLALSLLSAIPAAMDNFRPIELYHPLFTYRFIALLLLALGLFFQSRWTDQFKEPVFIHKLSDILRVGIVASIFILLTVEVRDYYCLKISQESPGYDIMSRMYRKSWGNQQQLAISITWLTYSMLLMVIGIYRQRLNIRLVSIILFGLTIAKVFFYDLSYLDTIHRIVSFIGLGVILILVSFLYQKYKHIIGISKTRD